METREALRRIKAAWDNADAVSVSVDCRELLELEPDSEFALRYLARAAALTEDWSDVFSAGLALASRRPAEAFSAARKLNKAGFTLQAARIFSELRIGPDWFSAKVADTAAKEAMGLLKAGTAASARGDDSLAKACWVAGAHISPTSKVFPERLLLLAKAALEETRQQDLSLNPVAYIAAWREVLSLQPKHVGAATRIAKAYDVTEKREDSVRAWLQVIAIEPENGTAVAKLLRLAKLGHADLVIRGLSELGRDEVSDPLVAQLRRARDDQANKLHERATKERYRETLLHARTVDRDAAPRKYLEAWKDVLVADPNNQIAANKIVGVANRLHDYAELADGLIVLMDITGGDHLMAVRLAKTALRAGSEEQALGALARHGAADFSVTPIANLRKRVIRTFRISMRQSELGVALACFKALTIADGADPEIEALKPTVVKKVVSEARTAEKSGDFAKAVPLANEALAIDPFNPLALAIVARDLSRHRRYRDVIRLCESCVKSGPEYAALWPLLSRAIEMEEGGRPAPMAVAV
jgi:tetratricopeptide (TPR) repeat protein